MARQVYPYAQVGRPVQKIKATWTVVERGRMTKFNVGLVERTRTGPAITGTETSYAVVRSKEAIVPNGVKLRALEAVPFKESGFRRHHPLKARAPEVWHSSRPHAEAKFDRLTGRLRPKPTSTTAAVAPAALTTAPTPIEAPAAVEARPSDGVQHGPVGDSTRLLPPTFSWGAPDLSACTEATTPAPAFPRAILGDRWASWCADVAAGANGHFDYVAGALLAATAGLVGNAVTVRAGGAFVQPSILWVCLVGKSGAGKTPATTAISDIVDGLEARCGRRQRLRDVTVAASVGLAADNPKGLILFRDELSGWWTAMKRTGGEDFWLEAFNGKAFSKDRKNEEPLFVENLSISVVGGAQPSTVKDITTDGKNRGFSSRWLFAYPEQVIGYADSDVEIDIEWATAALARLAMLPVGSACIPLSSDAQATFRAWWDAKRRENADHDGLWAEWMQKQGGNALRLALTLELLKWSAGGAVELPTAISPETVRDALALIDEWAIPMAQRTLEVMYRSPSDQQAVALARHLRRAKLGAFNARQLRRGEYGPAGALSEPATMEAACRVLMEAGLIRFVGARNHSHKGRTAGDYEVNPALFEAGLSGAR